MNLKIRFLLAVIVVTPIYTAAQTARNPLNHEPAQIALQKRLSSWKLADETFYYADGRQFDKQSSLYDTSGRKTADVTLRWSEADQTWQNSMITEYLHEKDKEIVITKSGRRTASKTEIVSDPDGNPVFSLTYSWNKNKDAWSTNPYLRCEWIYDGNGLLTTYLKRYKNVNTNEWNTADMRILYRYEAGQLIEELFQQWNPEQEQWIDKGKYRYSNDSEQQKTALSYVYASGEWIIDGKTVYSYDDEGKITRCSFFKSNTDESLSAYSLITYSESFDLPRTIESEALTVYPNPAVSSFELSVPKDYTGKIMNLFDLSGKQALTIQISNQKTQVDVSRLSRGIYMLKIGDINQKIIIQ